MSDVPIRTLKCFDNDSYCGPVRKFYVSTWVFDMSFSSFFVSSLYLIELSLVLPCSGAYVLCFLLLLSSSYCFEMSLNRNGLVSCRSVWTPLLRNHFLSHYKEFCRVKRIKVCLFCCDIIYRKSDRCFGSPGKRLFRYMVYWNGLGPRDSVYGGVCPGSCEWEYSRRGPVDLTGSVSTPGVQVLRGFLWSGMFLRSYIFFGTQIPRSTVVLN